MGTFRFSRRAEADLLEIGRYTLQTWGENQAINYLDNLEACCRNLAENPELGRSCEEIHSGLRRLACGRHEIFYRQDLGGILVCRILHQRMVPKRHAIDHEA